MAYLARWRQNEPARDFYSGLNRLNRMMDEALAKFDGLLRHTRPPG